MSDRRSDYIRTDQLADALVPLDTIMTVFRISRRTLEYWCKADEITRHEYPGGKAIRWGDIPTNGTRWKRPNAEGGE